MREILNLKENWSFSMDESKWEAISLPHTWNNLDGQDGGDDYLKTKCHYKRELTFTQEDMDKECFLNFEGANSVAEVYLNDVFLGHHKGGYSTFRIPLRAAMKKGINHLLVTVDNTIRDDVYPTMADFTFSGGLYRMVSLYKVEKAHIALMDMGSEGVYITPALNEDLTQATIKVRALTEGALNESLKFDLLDQDGKVIQSIESKINEMGTEVNFILDTPTLWHGVLNPYLYQMRVSLLNQEQKQDEVQIPFGIRSFRVDVNEGFFLNGESYHLHGVSRHQDHKDKGFAINRENHDQDMELIKEIGATTIRLAHYQHDQYFYDLSDKNGMVLWAEIPLISKYTGTDEADVNAISQMTELIKQNYNHPSICFWGVSNEITIGGDSERLISFLHEQNELTKRLDPTRWTTMANLLMVPIDSPHNHITDVVSYNNYFGWYLGEVEQHGPWLDKFHHENPLVPIGLSEYGAEGILTYQNDNPKKKDYSETYHAYYHEVMLEIFSTRPYIWSTHVWNMFDFASDLRDEGGVKGMNNKGLVTHDRSIKKDAFYIYKAYWSHDPFIHVTGRRFVNRVEGKTDVKVYSNLEEITLYVNGEKIQTLTKNKVFHFTDVSLKLGENIIKAEGMDQEDVIYINGVKEEDPSYFLEKIDPNDPSVKNWFINDDYENKEVIINENYFSTEDLIKDLLHNEEAKVILLKYMGMLMNKTLGEEDLKDQAMALNMQLRFVLDAMGGNQVPEEAKDIINSSLQKIKK